MNTAAPVCGRERRAVKCARWLALLSLAFWLVGALYTDRYRWAQFVWWTPEALFALVALPAFVGAMWTTMRRRALEASSMPLPVWRILQGIAPFLIIAGNVIVSDVGWRRWDDGVWRDRSRLQLVQWNAGWPGSLAGEAPASTLLQLEPDVAVISNPYKLLGDGRQDRWRAQGYDIVNLGVFLVASRLPVIEARVVTSVAGRVGANVVVARAGRVIRLLAVDLPSDPTESRRSVAERFREELEGTATTEKAEGWDLVLGDLNIARGSESLVTMFDRPAWRFVDAWSSAGRGVGASWPSRLPFLHIDHVLLGPSVRAVQARFVDVGGSGHRAQQVTIELLPESAAGR